MFSQFLGFVGMVFIIFAYFKLTRTINPWLPMSIKFNVVNLIGAVLLIISLCFHFNLGSFLIEVFWIIIAVKALYTTLKGKANAVTR